MNDSLPLTESILDLCINAIYDQGETVEDCLALYPEQRASIEPLLRLTERLQSGKNLTPPADFQISARERLEKRLADFPQSATARQSATAWQSAPGIQADPAARLSTPVKSTPEARPAPFARVPARRPAAPLPRHLPGRIPTRATWAYAAGLALIVLMLLVSTTASYAQRALPGDPLYGVKRAGEQAQLAIAPSAAAGASLHLKFVDQRFQEVSALVQEGQTTHLPTAIQSYQAEISTTHAYATSNELTRPEKARVMVQLAQQLVQNDQDLASLVTNLPKTRPGVSAQTVTLISSQTKPAADAMHQLYALLLDEIRDNPDVPQEFQGFPGVETFTAPWNDETATPQPTHTRFLPTPTPGAAKPEEGGSEWPTTVSTAWPTPWITAWATLIPEGTPVPPSYLVQTLFPTYVKTYLPTNLPTFLQTYFPPDDGQDVTGDDDFPGWEWPDDFPQDDGGDEPPPGWGWP